ncbi:MAG: gliding motility-associated C-terminal domain-containing protein [Bacteroidota bacterium]
MRPSLLTIFSVCLFVLSNTIQAQSLQVDLQATAPTCSNYTNGNILSSVTGGESPYTYNWSNGSTASGIYGLIAGTYILTVTDADGATVEATATLTAPDPLEVSIEATGDVCEDLSTPYQVTVMGGTAPYTYDWSDGSDEATFSAPAPGNYFLTVTDANGCQSVAALNVRGMLEVKVIAQDVRCADFCDASVTAMVTGGREPFSYIWNTGDTTQIVDMLPVGTYTVTVTDADDCTEIASGTVGGPPAIDAEVTVENTCEEDGNLFARVTANGGEGDFFFLWSTGATGASIGDLERGEDYFVVIFDANQCNDTLRFTVPEAPNLVVEGSKTDVTCTNINNGSATATVMGGTAPYTFEWSNGSTTTTSDNSNTLDELPEGEYTVTVTDAEGCTGTTTVTVASNGDLELDLSSTPTTCPDDADGMANAIGIGGTGVYTYLWSDGQTTGTAINLTAGTYTVTVTDVGFPSCTAVGTVTVSSVGISDIDVSIDTTGGTVIVATPVGGRGPFTFEWSNGEDGAIANNYMACEDETYSVTVTDSDGCEQVKMGEIPCDEENNLVVNVETTPTCRDANDGAATITIEGGTEPYTINWGNDTEGNINTGLAAGAYQVIVTDANGNERVINYIIDQINLDVSVETIQQACGTDEGGSIFLDIEGDEPPFTITWSDSSLSGDSLENVAVGTYMVTITNEAGCEQVRTIEVTEEPGVTSSVEVTPADCGQENGSIVVTPSGSNTPFTFEWSTRDTTARLVNIAPGEYSYTITDAEGCEDKRTVTVTEEDLMVDVSSTPTTCPEDAEGTATATVTDGESNYTYLWSDGQTTATATSLVAGTYTVTVTDPDAPQCEAIETVTVDATGLTGVSVSVDTSGGSTTIIATPIGGNAPYTYMWSNGEDGPIATGYMACEDEMYSVTVTDADGCEQIQTGDIPCDEENNLVIDIETTPTCRDAADGTATISIEGGTEPYTIDWGNDTEGDINTGLEAGAYRVVVVDANGNRRVVDYFIDQINLEVSVETTQQTCGTDEGGSIFLDIEGDEPPFTITWSDNRLLGDSLENVAVGTYMVTITNEAGCEQIRTIEVTEEPGVTSTVEVTPSDCGQENGSITVTPSGSNTPFTFEWSTGDTTARLVNVASGEYSYTVTDANGCTDEQTVTVTEEININIDATPTAATCGGATDGRITIDVSGGTEPYVYQINGDTVGVETTGLTSGTYDILVTDANGCQQSSSVTVDEDNDIQVLIDTQIDEDTGLGTLIAVVGGGTEPYTYAWSTGDTTVMISDLEPGCYELTITDANGCTQESEASITGVPELTIEPNCDGTATVSTSPVGGCSNAMITWSDGSTGTTTTLPEGDQSVTITFDGDEEDITIDFTVEAPNLEIESSSVTDATCNDADGSATVSVLEGAANYDFVWMLGDSVIAEITDSEEASSTLDNLAEGTYTVMVIDANGCEQEVTINIAAENSIDVNIADVSVCQGEEVEIEVENNSEDELMYSWIPADLFAEGTANSENPEFIGTESTTVMVTVTNEAGCEVERSVSINFQDRTAPDTDQITFSETCLGFELTFDGNGQTQGYTWRFGDPNNSDDISQNPNPVYTYSEAGIFTVTLIPTDAAACQDTAMFEVTVAGEQELDFQISGEPLVCGEESNVFSVDDTQLNVEWYAAGDLENPLSTLNSAELAAGEYVVRVTNELGCTGEQTYIVEDRTVNIDLEESYCTCVGEELPISISSLIEGDELTFEWSPENPDLIDLTDPANPIFMLDETTTFMTTVTNQFGCSITREVTIDVGEQPVIDGIFPDKDTIALGESTNIRIEGAQGNYSYRWINDPSLDRLDTADPLAAPTQTTVYTVEIFNEDDPCGCVLTRTVEIVVLDLPCEDPYVFIPNAFTPNGDGINDVIRVFGPHIEALNLKIFNRWGELVFETDDVDGEWNGTHQRTGQLAEGRVFAYILNVECIGGETYEKRGNITLLR